MTPVALATDLDRSSRRRRCGACGGRGQPVDQAAASRARGRRRRFAIGSPAAATRSGGLRRSISTSGASSSRRFAPGMRWSGSRATRPARPGISTAPLRLSPASRGRSPRAGASPWRARRRRRRGSRQRAKAVFTPGRRWPIACARVAAPPARPAASWRSCTARSRAATPARRPTSVPCCVPSCAPRRRPPVAGRPRPSDQLQGARLARSAPRVRRSGLPRTAVDARGSLRGMARAGRLAMRSGGPGAQAAKALTASQDLRDHAAIEAATCGRWSRPSSKASRSCSSPGRPAPWTKPAPRSITFRLTSWSPTPRPAGGAARWCWNRDDGRFPSSATAARVHLPALAELPARAGRDPAVGGKPCRSRDSPLPIARCCSTRSRASTSSARDTFPPSPGGDRQLASRHDRGRVARDRRRLTRNEPATSRWARRRRRAWSWSRRSSRRSRRPSRRSSTPAAAMPDVLWWSSRIRPRAPDPTRRARGGARARPDVAARGDLGALTTFADAIVTVNSTAAIEAMLLDVPALVVALPNNLTPFVDAGRHGRRGDARGHRAGAAGSAV